MKCMIYFACLLLVICGCYDKERFAAHERRLIEIERLYGHLDRRMESNDCLHDYELCEIRRRVGITNDLPTFVAYNGGGGLSPEYKRLEARLDELEKWRYVVDPEIYEIRNTSYDTLISMIYERDRIVSTNAWRIDHLSDRVDRIEREVRQGVQ